MAQSVHFPFLKASVVREAAFSAAGKMYWVDNSTDLIGRANLDGSSVKDITPIGVSGPKDIALDVAAGKMYWSESTLDRIRRANLDGTNPEDIITGPGNVRGIALDI